MTTTQPTALQSQPAAAVSDDEIRDALEAAFLNEPGKRNLADDMRIARAILALRPQADTLCFYLSTMLACPPSDSDVVAAVESLLPLRPQAVPMSHHDVVVMQFKLGPKFNDMTIGDLQMIVTAVEAHHGITAQGAQGGERSKR